MLPKVASDQTKASKRRPSASSAATLCVKPPVLVPARVAVCRVPPRVRLGNLLGARFLSSTIHMFPERPKLHSGHGSNTNGLATAATDRFSRLRLAIQFSQNSQRFLIGDKTQVSKKNDLEAPSWKANTKL